MIDSWAAAVAAVAGGYLLGSIPVAVLAGRARGFDPRQVGDHNPGFWNMKDQLGWAGAVPVLAGDTLKGTAAGLLGLILAHGFLQHGFLRPGLLGPGAPQGEALVYAAVAAAMIGHAWPVFARLRGGRSVLTFAGGFAVICPPAFGLGIALCAGVALFTRSFAVGARTGVFAVPFLQLIFTPALEVAATGALMSLIGVRFVTAALASRHQKGRRPGPDASRPPQPMTQQASPQTPGPGAATAPRTEPGTPGSGGPARTAPAESSRPSSG
jgi:acyl phosphate:glycerol-3-phosphate acyltransferase